MADKRWYAFRSSRRLHTWEDAAKTWRERTLAAEAALRRIEENSHAEPAMNISELVASDCRTQAEAERVVAKLRAQGVQARLMPGHKDRWLVVIPRKPLEKEEK